jgi:hypothetical protein
LRPRRRRRVLPFFFKVRVPWFSRLLNSRHSQLTLLLLPVLLLLLVTSHSNA